MNIFFQLRTLVFLKHEKKEEEESKERLWQEVGRFVTGGEQKNEEMNCDAKGSKKGLKSETKGREILIREEEEKKDA